MIAALGALVALAGGGQQASAQETLKVAIPQRGAWDAGVAELGLRGGIFKKHGSNLEILYTQAGPESIQALIGGSIDIATASGRLGRGRHLRHAARRSASSAAR